MFISAGVEPGNNPLVVLEQLADGSVIVRATTTIVDDTARVKEVQGYMHKQKRRNSKSLSAVEDEQLDNFRLEYEEYKLPAGAYTMNTDVVGFFSRMIVKTYPLISLMLFPRPARLAAV